MSGSTSVFNQPKPVVTLESNLLDAITAGAQPYPVPEGRKYEYGTAGVSSQLHYDSKNANRKYSSA